MRDCPVYILDLSAEVAPKIGIPQCDITNPEVGTLFSDPPLSSNLPRRLGSQPALPSCL